ncbi:flagellar basal body-associated protein FliL [Clostridium moniliforme]|uniref:Flagellar basal body-associated protein FliL n=1 Tax=Clostridium moniliforme TaxID=39489 RepID=A0ABS4F0P6_9CLOT|nr:hypothetical protein [Clostridium moniliforme]MBP1889812.1 flagellar basal body-associated protein FliL [Clostridium moniliforme]
MKVSKKKKIIIGIIAVIIIFIAFSVIKHIIFFKQDSIKYLENYKTTHDYEQTVQELNNLYTGKDQNEKQEVYNIIFKDEIEQAKAKQKIAISDLKIIKDPYKNQAEFKIDNPTDQEIFYIELNINYLDKNKKVISSDYTNAMSIAPHSKRLKQVYLNPPEGTKGISVEITKVKFENY